MPLFSVAGQLIVAFLSGAVLHSARGPGAAVVSCHCDCDCTTAARFEGLALLVLGLCLGLALPRSWRAARSWILGFLAGTRQPAIASAPATRPVGGPPSRPLGGVARPVLAATAA